jgi:hypothetical protein
MNHDREIAGGRASGFKNERTSSDEKKPATLLSRILLAHDADLPRTGNQKVKSH